MASGGGARAWEFLKENLEFQAAYEAGDGAAHALEDAPFPIRRQSDADRRIARFGVWARENPFARDGPASPFWRVAPMLDVVPLRREGFAPVDLAREVGTALAGLRLPDGALILKLERGGRARQLRIAEGAAFDPLRDGIRVVMEVGPGWPRRHALSGSLWRLLSVPAPPKGRGRGPGIANC